ncbi:MAG: hypothetical protein GXO86_04165 [Chlorobi bacterium]|nr:hypothetical protein [Chlorobiota bacterium]
MAEVEDTVNFQVDKPERLARIAYRIQPVSPINGQYFSTNDTLVFRWKAPADSVKARFVILDDISHKTVYYSRVNLSDSIFILFPGMLPPGKYIWYVHDTLTLNYFSIK